MKALCAKAREILSEESNIQRVDSPVTVRMTQNRTLKCCHCLDAKIGIQLQSYYDGTVRFRCN